METRGGGLTEEEVCGYLQHGIAEIVRRWEGVVRSEVAAARPQPAPTLIDDLPQVIQEVTASLAAPGVRDSAEEAGPGSEQHGRQRATLPGYSLDQVIREYHLLRRVMLELLLQHGPLSPDAALKLHTAIDAAVEREATSYAREMLDQQRRLQKLTDTALSRLTYEELLPELLKRVAEALLTDTAVVLLLEEGNVLRVHAAVGLEEEVRQEVRVPVGQGFAGRIAARGKPVILDDVRRARVHSPYLRAKGIHSLLGVPLLREGRSIGVLHVGTLEGRRFTAQDTRLLQLVADRVAAAIENARLIQELQQANRSKSDFIAILAHELRTPLSAIHNAVYILENMQIADEHSARQLSTIQRQAQQLARLAEDLVDINRIARGDLEIRLEQISLNRLARQAAETSRPLIDSRGQELSVEIAGEELPVRGDPARLEQILGNLLGNAARYTEPGGRIRLIVSREGEEAVLQVRDSGIGIDPVVLPQIFDMFHQVDPGAARSRAGLGVGLALVKRLVELHGGAISASSEGPGSGSEFTVRLPLAAD